MWIDDEEDGVLVLPSSLDLTLAAALQKALLARAETNAKLIVAAADVERVSTAVVQVLLAAATEARTRHLAFELREPSAALAEALADLGVAAPFAAPAT